MLVQKIMFVHPSRGRPEMAMEAFQNIISTMKGNTSFSYWISLDLDDTTVSEYQQIFSKTEVQIIVGDNKNEVVEATNRAAAKITSEDLIFCNTDDYRFDPGWDLPLLECCRNAGEMYLFYYPEFPGGYAIPQILSRTFYQKLGFVFYPEYISMWADTDLLETAKTFGCAFPVSGLPFKHVHPFRGMRPWDDTTGRTNERWKYGQGHRIFEKRKASNFGLTSSTSSWDHLHWSEISREVRKQQRGRRRA